MKWSITVFLFCAVAALIAVSVYVCYREVPAPERNISSRYHPISLEGFSCKIKGVGIAVKSLDVRKAKSGGITFGGFNVLQIEGLDLTIYEEDSTVPADTARGDAVALKAESTEDALSTIRRTLVSNLKFAAVDVRGLRLFRVAKGNPQPWLSADRLKSSGVKLRLEGLRRHEDGHIVPLGEGRIKVDNGYFIEYGENCSQRIQIL